ncbi:MAG TPA: hypothetical protein VKE49_10685 [Myxococcaceae bacterium]|nr:hypothetical protein [Myxococcaceae bacterium]
MNAHHLKPVWPVAVLTAGALAIGCPPKQVQTAPLATPPPSVQVPPGCQRDLSGSYVHAQRPEFRYLIRDDGTALNMSVERARADAGSSAPDGGGRVSIALARTARGFIGQARATAFVTTGQPCPVEFFTEVIGCDDAGLLLRSAATAAVDESCRTPPGGIHAAMMEHRLIRESSAPPLDAGSPESEARGTAAPEPE